jgi:hypothetical protein
MMNRYEEASKELEKLRSMNRLLKSSLKVESNSKKTIDTSKHFLQDLDEEYEETNHKLQRLKLEREKRKQDQQKEVTSGEENLNDTFLSSDLPNASISRLSENDRFNSSRTRNSSSKILNNTNTSFNGSTYTTRSSQSFTSPSSTRQYRDLDIEDKPNFDVGHFSMYHTYHSARDRHRSDLDTSRSLSPLKDRGTHTHGTQTLDDSHLNISGSHRQKESHHHLHEDTRESYNQNGHHHDIPSTSFSSTYPHSSTSFSHTTTANNNNLSATTSVMSAFRELQNKTKHIENERYLLLKEKDELKNKIMESKRNAAIHRNKLEIETTESLLNHRNHYEKVQKVYNDLNYQFLTQREHHESLEKKLSHQEKHYHGLQHDLIHYQEKLLALEKHKISLEKTMNDSKMRVGDLELNQRLSPQKHSRSEFPLLQEMNSLEDDVRAVHQEQSSIDRKVVHLQDYIDLILKINGDLCQTLIQREKAKNQFLRALSPPPRYSWAKDVPYNNVIDMVNDAARVHASIALENSALKVTENAIKSVVDALSPSSSAYHSANRRKSPMRGGGASRSQSPSSTTPTRMRGHSQRQSSSSGGIYNSPERIERRLHSSMNTLSSPSKEKHSATHHSHVSFDDQINMQSDEGEEQEESEEDEEEEEDDDETDRNMKNMGRLVKEYSNLKRSNGKLTKKRKKKKKTSSSSSSNIRRSRSLEASTASSRRRSHSGSNSSFRQHSLETVLARQGAITSATRFAAAVDAAANAARIVDNPTPVNALHRSGGGSYPPAPPSSSSAHNTTMTTNVHDSHDPANKLSFIPASSSKNNEFNMIASVSKASRASKQLNATLASK